MVDGGGPPGDRGAADRGSRPAGHRGRPRSAEARIWPANTAFGYRWDFAEAERRFREALDLGPRVASVHGYYACFLAASGRTGQAIEQPRRAVDLEPSSSLMNANLGLVLYYAGDSDRAIRRFQMLLDLDESYSWARILLGWAAISAGDLDLAWAQYRKLEEMVGGGEPGLDAVLGLIQARRGDTAGARRRLASMDAAAAGRYVQPYFHALVHLGLGDRETAVTWLERAYLDRYVYVSFLGVDPLFRELHTSPRFRALLKKVLPS